MQSPVLAPSNDDATMIPPEWAPHKAIWTAWPWLEHEWPAPIAEVRDEVEGMIRLLAEGDTVKVLITGGREVMEEAKSRLSDVAEIIEIPYGDIWLRDTGPIFSGRGGVAHLFRFNGWGGKYIMQNDDSVNEKIAAHAGVKTQKHNFILEGGSIDLDGNGLCLTTRQCLLNSNRNPGMTEARAESFLQETLGVKKLLWLDEGLLNDHTDGHIDNIARFVGAGKVVCQSPNGEDDPNTAILFAIQQKLSKMTDVNGKPLQVITIPSPGRVTTEEGVPVAASHMNFIIGNKTVPVPVYNERGEEAVAALRPLFPGREVAGLSSRAIISGGGSFHCITQQQPL